MFRMVTNFSEKVRVCEEGRKTFGIHLANFFLDRCLPSGRKMIADMSVRSICRICQFSLFEIVSRDMLACLFPFTQMRFLWQLSSVLSDQFQVPETKEFKVIITLPLNVWVLNGSLGLKEPHVLIYIWSLTQQH